MIVRHRSSSGGLRGSRRSFSDFAPFFAQKAQSFFLQALTFSRSAATRERYSVRFGRRTASGGSSQAEARRLAPVPPARGSAPRVTPPGRPGPGVAAAAPFAEPSRPSGVRAAPAVEGRPLALPLAVGVGLTREGPMPTARGRASRPTCPESRGRGLAELWTGLAVRHEQGWERMLTAPPIDDPPSASGMGPDLAHGDHRAPTR